MTKQEKLRTYIEDRLYRLGPLIEELSGWVDQVEDPDLRRLLSEEVDYRLIQGMSPRVKIAAGAALRSTASPEALLAAIYAAD